MVSAKARTRRLRCAASPSQMIKSLRPMVWVQCFEKLNDLWTLDRPGEEAKVETNTADVVDHRQLLPVEVVLNTGVSSFGAQVRTRVGRSDSPDSSTKTIIRPCFAAFFLALASVFSSSG